MLIQSEGPEQEPEELIENPRIAELIQGAIDEVNDDLASFEKVKYFRLLPRDFAEAEGELTPTLQTRRRTIQERWSSRLGSSRQPRPARELLIPPSTNPCVPVAGTVC